MILSNIHEEDLTMYEQQQEPEVEIPEEMLEEFENAKGED